MDITNCTARKFLVLSFLILSVCRVYAQKEDINTGKYHPAKEHFEQKYVKQNHVRIPESQIKIDSNRVSLGRGKMIHFPADIDADDQLIIVSGLLDPMKIVGRPSLMIGNINELTLLNSDDKTKRFSFLVLPNLSQYGEDKEEQALKSRLNFDIYFFELQNKNATKDTTFKEFVDGAVLTYFGYGGIIP